MLSRRKSVQIVFVVAIILTLAFIFSLNHLVATTFTPQAQTSHIHIQQISSVKMIQAGTRLTYTLSVTAYVTQPIPVTITNILPAQVHTDEAMAGTFIHPNNRLIWHTVIHDDIDRWRQTFSVTATEGYAGPLLNYVEVSTQNAIFTSTYMVRAVLTRTQQFLPLVMHNVTPQDNNLLVNPGFEGIGLPIDNEQPNYNNWTRDTFNGKQYGEIFTPEGWVTWWEEGDYKRPECKVIPNEPPFRGDGILPSRIYQGYYSGMCFTFYGKQNTGYYQVVRDLPPGLVVQGWFYAHAWSCSEDNPPLSCGDPNAFSFRVGLDTAGGTDPFSDAIIWSDKYYNYDTYARVGPISATVEQSGTVTFYLSAHAKWPNKHNDAYWDNPTLIISQP